MLLDKCLPNLRPVDLPVTVNLTSETLTEKGLVPPPVSGRIVASTATGANA